MIRSEKIESIAAALFKVQGQLSPMRKDGENPFTNSKFIKLETIWGTVLPLFQDAGIYLAAFPDTATEDAISVTTIAFHVATEQYIGSTMTVPFKDEAKKSSAQVVGSVISYARRYALLALLGIVHDDDDGNMGRTTATQPQRQQAQRPQARPAAQPERNPIDVAFDTMSVPDQARATLYDGALEQAHGDKALAAAAIAGWARDGYKWNEQSGTIVPKK